MTGHNRTDHILDAIDHALADDTVSPDAMRSSPDPDAHQGPDPYGYYRAADAVSVRRGGIRYDSPLTDAIREQAWHEIAIPTLPLPHLPFNPGSRIVGVGSYTTREYPHVVFESDVYIRDSALVRGGYTEPFIFPAVLGRRPPTDPAAGLRETDWAYAAARMARNLGIPREAMGYPGQRAQAANQIASAFGVPRRFLPLPSPRRDNEINQLMALTNQINVAMQPFITTMRASWQQIRDFLSSLDNPPPTREALLEARRHRNTGPANRRGLDGRSRR